MFSERETDNYIDNMEAENQTYVDKELNYAKKCYNLEGKIGCPLEVRCEVVPNSYIFTFGTSMETQEVITRRKVITISKEGIYISYATVNGKERDMILPWGAYKMTWWLKSDRSE